VDSPLAILSPESLAIVLPAILLMLLIGFLLGRMGRRELVESDSRLRRRLEIAERQTGEQSKRTIAKMRRELDTVSNLALALPSVVRNLNRDDIDPTDVPPLILQLANAVFEPKQMLLYGIRSAGPGGAGRVLTLLAHRGIDPLPDALRQVDIGVGKIGWVARHELEMRNEDWESLRISEGLAIPDNHPLLRADITGPLIHHAKQRQYVLGVLCIGGPRIRPRDEKLMFQMVTNFGSLGQVLAQNMTRLRSAAHHDGLTGLLNKKCFLDDVGPRSLVACERRGRPFSVFIFDIDHFKNFNDTNGHPAGDELLRRMGGLIRRHLRPGDLACRYGGEEFVVAMPDTDQHRALALAEALRVTVENEPFENRDGQPLGCISISGGVASSPKDGGSVVELVRHADEALYGCKKAGRNRVAPYKGIEIGDTSELPPVLEGLGEPIDAVDPPVQR
jgi:diguanylate cyclase (GGDEF)-like protein